ncbi:MAG: pirin family protein [Desulfuromonadales bacterium]|jgi:redox-sensitive bicupin YhaK (pirin superfamily)
MSDLLNQTDGCTCNEAPGSAIRYSLEPEEKDLGGFSVRRLLPAREVKAVGPFVFFDHLGPARFAPGEGIDVRPHPHIGLATVTYLFAGEILHRDSLGSVQPIRPKAINWMTAGRGIVHSERTPPDVRAAGHTVHALQLWVALPEAAEETEPTFYHYEADRMPERVESDKSIRVMVGEAFGLVSPVKTWSPTLYVEVNLQAGASITLPDAVAERAAYLVAGAARTRHAAIPLHAMAVFDETPQIEIVATEDSRLILIGGQPLGKRTVWWNLVSSRKDRIEQAKRDWQEGRFAKVPGETEFIPLPD